MKREARRKGKIREAFRFRPLLRERAVFVVESVPIASKSVDYFQISIEHQKYTLKYAYDVK